MQVHYGCDSRRQLPLDGDSGAQGRLNLQGECIIGLYSQTCGAVATTDEKIPEGRAADESAQAQNATAVVHADIDDIVGINGDLKLARRFPAGCCRCQRPGACMSMEHY